MVVVRRLVWDAWNVPHIARHQVTSNEVEELRQGKFLTVPTYGGRLRIIGVTKVNRMIAAILHPLGKATFYVVTARPASRKERRLYQAKVGKGVT